MADREYNPTLAASKTQAQIHTEVKNVIHDAWVFFSLEKGTWRAPIGTNWTREYDHATVTIRASRFYRYPWAEYRGELGEYDCNLGKTVGAPRGVLTAEIPA